MPGEWLVWAATAALVCGLQLVVVAHHPEPADDEPDACTKPRYAQLARSSAALGLLVASALLCIPIPSLPLALRPAWVVWASAGLVLVYVDARTTWLPIRASRVTFIALLAGFGLGMAIDPGWWPGLIIRALVGAGLAGGLFFVLWWRSRALGFGDVRLAAMTGALAAAGSVQGWFAALLAGAIASACWGLGTTWWRRRHPSVLGRTFPYGPGLWLGPWLAWAWISLG